MAIHLHIITKVTVELTMLYINCSEFLNISGTNLFMEVSHFIVPVILLIVTQVDACMHMHTHYFLHRMHAAIRPILTANVL